MLFNAHVALMSSKFGCLHFILLSLWMDDSMGSKATNMCVYPTVYIYIYIFIYMVYRNIFMNVT